MRTSPCNSCGAPIIWVKTERGNRMPVDAEPTDQGNIDLHCPMGEVPSAIYLRRADLEKRRDDAAVVGGRMAPLYMSHFVRCPFAAQHRKRATR